MLGQSELFQLIIQGGAVAVLSWMVYLFLTGRIISRHSHKEIVDPLKESILELKAELKNVSADARQAVVDVTASQRVTAQEQSRTIEVLRELVAELRAEQAPPKGGST